LLLGDAICPRQKAIDLAIGMTVDDPGEDVGQIFASTMLFRPR
jgi:hypothetical protein